MDGWRKFLEAVEASGWGQGTSWTPGKLLNELRHSRVVAVSGQSGEVRAVVIYRDNPVAREIIYLTTHPDWRGHGHMKKLLHKVVEDGGQEAWLEVHEGNGPAIQLYEDLGFIGVGRRRGYYPDGGDALLYSRLANFS